MIGVRLSVAGYGRGADGKMSGGKMMKSGAGVRRSNVLSGVVPPIVPANLPRARAARGRPERRVAILTRPGDGGAAGPSEPHVIDMTWLMAASSCRCPCRQDGHLPLRARGHLERVSVGSGVPLGGGGTAPPISTTPWGGEVVELVEMGRMRVEEARRRRLHRHARRGIIDRKLLRLRHGGPYEDAGEDRPSGRGGGEALDAGASEMLR